MKYKSNIFIGFVLTLLISTLALFNFYGELLKSPNSKYFASSNDGLKSYYTGTYHIKYDSTYLRSEAMNYPYGESIFFTDSHPVISNTLKFITRNVTDVSDYFPGTLNLLMLISLVLAAVFLYLIFIEFGLPPFYSVIPAVGIVFLSPQVDRMGGHFSLSYHFIFPLMIYLLLRFYKNPKVYLSILISLLSFFALASHQYLFAFNSVFSISLWAFLFYHKKVTLKSGSFHLAIQFFLPLLIYGLLYMSSNAVADRTSHPWGFMIYRAFPQSVFLPIGREYGKPVLSLLKSINLIDWEGYAYIGLVAVIGFLFVLKRTGIIIFKKRFSEILSLTDNNVLNLFFWMSFLALLYSFGIPYIFKMEFLLDYIGILRQMRGIARFAWLFYYMMNILVFYWLWKWTEKNGLVYLKCLVIFLAFGMLLYDAYLFNRGRQNLYNNEIPELATDYKSSWLNSVEKDKYQAIIPVPYFNIGSENLWIDNPDCMSSSYTFIVSQKTGLPTNGVMLSRTSISQSFNNIGLSLEPYRRPLVLEQCPDKRPFLLVVANCREYSEVEKNLVNSAIYVDSSDNFKLYEVSYNQLLTASDSLYSNTENEVKAGTFFEHDRFLSPDEELDFTYECYDSIPSSAAYGGKGSFEGAMDKYNLVFDDTIPGCRADEDYILSFWYGNVLTDVQLRATLILSYYDEAGNSIGEDWLGLLRNVKILDGNWALCETRFKMKDPRGHLKVLIINDQIRKGQILVDELLIRPVSTNIYLQSDKKIIKNNRVYYQGGS